MENQSQVEQDRQRAEIFDALGHPTRILILKVLSEGSLGFADLKKKTAIESSGHLQHHLSKLNGLIKTDDYGKYCLSDEGKDALLTVQIVENTSPRSKTKDKTKFKVGFKPVALLLITLLIATSAVAVYEYSQAISLNEKFAKANDVVTYYTKFGVIPTTNTNSSYTPPVSMYQAMLSTLDLYGFNKTSLGGWNIDATLEMWQTTTNNTLLSQNSLTGIPSDYSTVIKNGVMYRYIWIITIMDKLTGTPHIGLIDASTGDMPHFNFHNW